MNKFCDKCQKGHILKNGLWVKCSCLRTEELRQNLLDSGFEIGSRYYLWKSFLKIQCNSTIFDGARDELRRVVDPPRLDGSIVTFKGENRGLFALTGIVHLAEIGHPVLATTLERLGDYYASQGTYREEWRKTRSHPVLFVYFGRELENSLSTKIFIYMCQYRGGQDGMLTFFLNNSSIANGEDRPALLSKDAYKEYDKVKVEYEANDARFKSIFRVIHVGLSTEKGGWVTSDEKIKPAERKL